MNNTFTFYSDSGHGWLEVPIILCRELGLQGKITGYSYAKNGYLYLEEDCDAFTFIKAYCDQTKIDRQDFVKATKRVYHETSPIRSYRDSVPADLLKN